MKCKIFVFLTLFLSVSSATIITSILKDLTPNIAGIGRTIEGVTKEVGGLIGDTFFNLDRIVGDAENLIQVKLANIDLILSRPETSTKELCASELKTLRNNLNLSVLRNCIDTVNVKNSLSESLVEIGLLRSECFSIVSKCMPRANGARQCIIDGTKTVEADLNAKQVVFRQNIDSIQRNVNDCVNRNQRIVSINIDDAIQNYNKCITG